MADLKVVKEAAERIFQSYELAIEDQKEAKDKDIPKKFEQRAALELKKFLAQKYGGNWNVVIGKISQVTMKHKPEEAVVYFSTRGLNVLAFEYNP